MATGMKPSAFLGSLFNSTFKTNPWSIASFIGNSGKYETYWANTSSNSLVNSLIRERNADIKRMMEDLMPGKDIVVEIDEQIVFNQLDDHANAIWSLLLATGYPNRESGFGRYDVMLEPFDQSKKAFIFEFKVLDSDEDEETLEDTLVNAHSQIEEKGYEAELIAEGFLPEQIRKYGFAFKGKTCLIG